ncbi:hypothetical protein HanHA300_Chr13g0501521 [Helianthus annuus]|nr:hypothetical protein HanHA300_Chr13g0501521 [Helianthus annuus]KAJ0499459.1 hypothetical protein HanHA89_Chr13g0534291 [Helianthus annuus]KAJ0672916.1 hypothetical protein HanOQP8_Chr13g0502471 [Helianthus annuus]
MHLLYTRGMLLQIPQKYITDDPLYNFNLRNHGCSSCRDGEAVAEA